MKSNIITVMGAGAWGTAMAIHAARCGHRTVLVSRREEHAEEVNRERENKDYLGGFILDAMVEVTADVEFGVEESSVIFLACPSAGLRNVCQQIKPFMERILLCATIDHDLILHVKAESEKSRESDSIEIFDLEFMISHLDRH